MPCYEVETVEITRLREMIRELPQEFPVDPDPRRFAEFAVQKHELLRQVAEGYLDAFFCFLGVMHAVMKKKIDLLARDESRPHGRRSEYLYGFLAIYQSAAGNSEALIRLLLMEVFEENPELCAEFVAQLIVSETPAEMTHYVTSVQPAQSTDEANDHGEAGKEVVDSVKRVLKRFLDWLPLGRKKNRKERTERAFHGLNEILSIVIKAGG